MKKKRGVLLDIVLLVKKKCVKNGFEKIMLWAKENRIISSIIGATKDSNNGDGI